MSDTTNNQIKALQIVNSDDKTIFEDDNYIIPLYQRAFAWSDKEITQLIDDIYDFEAEKYYIGSLIVNVNSNGLYEVIDGQQRLTALFLLLNHLGYRWKNDSLCYECREKSNYTLNFLNSLLPNEDNRNKSVDEDKIEQPLIKGRDIIKQKFCSDKIDEVKFKEKLKNVKLFRIEVPPHTDLNRYFEIMNVRGEQLEQHDILKAKLMEPLDPDEQTAFSIIWDACRDMSGYVQMHFAKQQRELLFGGDWDWLNIDNIFSLTADNGSVHPQTAIKIIENKEPIQVWDGDEEAGNRIRFESIIDFPFFLLHVLKVFVATEFNEYFSAIPELLDDKKLLKTFTDIIDKWKSDKEFSLKFIKYLLKSRFLFDKYIIKREYKNEDTTGSWSLKELKVSGARSKKKSYYRDTYFGELNEWKTTYSPRAVTNLMLQSCLRVSYTSPKIMHWITELLKWLNVDDNLKKLSQFENQIVIIAQKPVIKFITDKNYMQGVNTPHIVLNYLDYLLWTKRSDAKYKGLNFDEFSFEFRNSVEHWYPQHPSKDMLKSWDDKDGDHLCRDYIGNICIISREVNSKFSNLAPTSKKHYKDIVQKGSLKLRIMGNKTTDDTLWRTTDYKIHGEEMLNLLKDNCQNIT